MELRKKKGRENAVWGGERERLGGARERESALENEGAGESGRFERQNENRK